MQNGIGVKAQSDIHLFKNQKLNCLKLKWALTSDICVTGKCANKNKIF